MRTDDLAAAVGGRLEGEARDAERLLPPERAAVGGVVVAPDRETVERVLADPAAAGLAILVVGEDVAVDDPPLPLLRHPSPRLALARIGALLHEEPRPAPGVHGSAHVAEGARVAADAAVGPFVSVGAGAVVGSGCVLDAGAVVGEGCFLGPGTRLFPRAVLYPNVRIGARGRIHAGAVLGADGFGYEAGPAGAEKIHHLGGVVLGDDVEVGAGTCIDRGTLDDTVVGDGSKIDNLCQVAHNVRIGRHCLVAGQTAIGGSTVIGDGVIVGGVATITDHVRIGDGARIAGRAGVTKDVPAGAAVGGLPAVPMRDWARERYLIGRLERVWSFVRAREREASRPASARRTEPAEAGPGEDEGSAA